MKTNTIENIIVKTREDLLFEQAIENSLKMASNLQTLKNVNRKEDYLAYVNSYNKVCETIAEMCITMEECEFMFNKNDIDTHYENKIQELINPDRF